MEGQHVLGTTPAGDGIVVVGTARQHSQVAVDGRWEVDVVPGIDRSPIGSSTTWHSRGWSAYSPRATLGSVVHTAHETAIIDGVAGIHKREVGLGTRALEKFSLPLVLRRFAIVGLLNSACGSDHIYRTKTSVSHVRKHR